MLFPHGPDIAESQSYVSIIVLPLLTGIAGIIGGAAGAYLSKRAEIRAIHNELSHVVQEAKLTRQATKEVESKIDQYYWQHQRLWEVKRDVYIDVVKNLGKVRATVSDLVGATASKSQVWEKREDREKADKSFSEAGKAFWESFGAFVISKTLTMLVAPIPLVNKFKATNNAIAAIRMQSLLTASSPEDMHTLLERGQSLALMIEELVGFIYEDMAKDQKRESSEAPPNES